MSKKIYISPSSQPANIYAAGNTNEQEQCRRIGAMLQVALERCGFEAKAGLTGTMYDRVRESNAWDADLHVPVHTNAFNKLLQGTRMFCSSVSGEGGKACKAIFDALAPLVPGESDGIKAATYYEITASKAYCAYVEVAFHDHPEQAQWIIDHTEEIAEAICRGICNHYGVEYVADGSVPAPEEKPEEQPAQPPAEETKTVYRVQVGAFHNKEYAENLMKELQDKGYKAFVTS